MAGPGGGVEGCKMRSNEVVLAQLSGPSHSESSSPG